MSAAQGRAFDFLFGRWDVENVKLQDPLGDGAPEWVQFAATAETRPILAGSRQHRCLLGTANARPRRVSRHHPAAIRYRG